jgi:hypothetical protein
MIYASRPGELAYLATGARLLAEQALTDGERQGSVSVRGIFEQAERSISSVSRPQWSF